jgi:hypothetical protein
VGGDDDGNPPGYIDGKEDGGAAEARTAAAARRTRLAKAHMDVRWGYPVDQLGRTGKGETAKGRIAGGKNSYRVGGGLPIQYRSTEKYSGALRKSVEASKHNRRVMKRGGTPRGDKTGETAHCAVL